MARTDVAGTVELVPTAASAYPDFIKASELRQKLSLSEGYYFNLRKLGKLPLTAYRIGKNIYHDKAELMEWLERHKPNSEYWCYESTVPGDLVKHCSDQAGVCTADGNIEGKE